MSRSTRWFVWFAAVLAVSAVSARPAQAHTGYFTGYVVHVSTDNLKVENTADTESLSFLLVPKFKQVFSNDGKTTYEMADIKPGMIVKVLYDQDMLGARHADKVFIVDAKGHALTAVR
jgi:hypothetical protein